MAKPNFQYEKRKRDLEKKAKKEAKRLRKLEKPETPEGPEVIVPEAVEASDEAVLASVGA